MNHIISLLRKAGAREVHVRVGSPEIVAPCFFGVDMKTRDQFVANGKTTDEICAALGADSLGYLSISGLVKSIGMRGEDLCVGCLTGEYPIPIAQDKYPRQKELESFSS